MTNRERRDLIEAVQDAIESTESYLDCNFTRGQLAGPQMPQEVRREKAKLQKLHGLYTKLNRRLI